MDALYFIDSSPNPKEVLYHHGIKGQKWGIRRYQNADGTLTDAGKRRYNGKSGEYRLISDMTKDLRKNRSENSYDTWAKTIDEKGMLNKFEDIYKYPDNNGSRLHLLNVYDKTESGKKRMAQIKEAEDKEAKRLEKNKGREYRDEQVNKLNEDIKNLYPDMHKDLGTKPGKETTKYVIDAIKHWNENDADMVIYQYMDEVLNYYHDGKISKETFENLYTGEVAHETLNFLGWGRTADEIKQLHSLPKIDYGLPDEEVKHYIYTIGRELYH